MNKSESDWLRIIDADAESLRASLSHHRNSLTILLAGLASVTWSILALVNEGMLTRQDIPFVAPYFLSMIWFSGTVIALVMISYRRSLLPLEEAIRGEATHGLVDASDLLAGVTHGVGVIASVFTIFLIWDGNFGLGLGLFFFAVVAYSGFICGVQMQVIFSSKGLLKIFLDYFEFPKRKRKSPKTQKPSPKVWTYRNIRASIIGVIMGSLVLLVAWQIAPDLDYLLLGTLFFIALYIAKSSFIQYSRMVDAGNAIGASMSLRLWVITDNPSSEQILERYRRISGIEEKKGKE